MFQTSKAQDAGHELDYKTIIGDWKRRDIQYCRFPGYDLTYAHYSKFPSWGLQDLALSKVNHISFEQRHPIPLPKSVSNQTELTDDEAFASIKPTFEKYSSNISCHKTDTKAAIRQQLMDNSNKEYVNVAIKVIFIVIYCVHEKAQYLRSYINEYSPLVLFSRWRNKISWNSFESMLC